MKKKQLLLQNTELFDQLSAAQLMMDELRQALQAKDAEIVALQSEIAAMKNKDSSPLPPLEETRENNPNIQDDLHYGASVIGRIVVEAAKYCNRLTSDSSDSNVKELVNLILGRTEVAKAEILKCVSSNLPYEQKCVEIDKQFSEAQDYFASMMAQQS